MNIEDQDGYDPFREEHPESGLITAGELLKVMGFREPKGAPPEPRRQLCGICHKPFMAKSGWFVRQWRYAAICSNCADGNNLPIGFLDESYRPPIRQMTCPRCGIKRGVDPVLRFNLWQYELTCAHCGQRSVTLRRIRRKCSGCLEDFFVNENRPSRQCATCRDKPEQREPFK